MTAPYIQLRTDIRKDERVSVVADLAGMPGGRHQAQGALVDLWCHCSDRGLQDAPSDCEGYAVSEPVIRRFLGPRGVEALLADGCDELALGVRRPDGLIYLRGTSETVGHLRTAAAGGRARASKPRALGGRFAPEGHDSVGEQTNAPAARQPESSCAPAVDQLASSDPRSQIPDTRSQIPDRDPEIPPSAGKAKRASRLTADWRPTRSKANQDAEQVAKARGVNLHEELAKLCDWATGTGARRADWDAVWRNWTRNARPESRRPTHANALELQLERVAMLEREEREQQEAKLS